MNKIDNFLQEHRHIKRLALGFGMLLATAAVIATVFAAIVVVRMFPDAARGAAVILSAIGFAYVMGLVMEA